MTKYATIDMHSGFVWWVGEANDAEDACRKSDIAGAGGVQAETYENVSASDAKSTAGGYAVYEVPNEFDVEDGQNANEIEATEAHHFVGFYRRVEA